MTHVTAYPTTERAPQLSPRGLLRVTGAAGVGAGALVVTSQLVGLTLDRAPTDPAAQILAVPATVYLITKLVGFLLLPLALVGAYLHQGADMGRMGLLGLVTATFGTVLTSGDWWFEAFAMTWLAGSASELVSAAPSPAMMVAAFTGFGLLAIGAVLLGLAIIRAGVLPRWVGMLLVAGGVPSLVAGFPPFLLPLGCAVAVIGWFVLRAAPR